MAVVLIIDDDPHIRTLWDYALSEDGFSVRTAPSGLEGVEIARREHVDVVVTDIHMPDKDGIETLLEIKSMNPEAKVVVVSGGGSVGRMSFLGAADKLGADATLAKPFDIHQLSAVVGALSGVRQVEAAEGQ